ncbi:uncharacterized protein LOC142220966 [Haematobia irritans]|uniref:uncharacterized protein LOC142220966 n=1 Tax=Haematobia irritans TaxID=7368 RepID=UPI003F4FF6AA
MNFEHLHKNICEYKMLICRKILIIALLAAIVGYSNANDDILQYIEVEAKQQIQIKLKNIEEGHLGESQYSYRCTAGLAKRARVTCSGHDRVTWSTPHNAELTLNCPPSGQGPIIDFTEIDFTVTTTNVNCIITAGGIGYDFIQVKVIANGTKLFEYSDNFYTE